VALVDLAPASAVFDPVLDPGQTFNDPEAGVTFRAISSSATGAIVHVDFAAPARSMNVSTARQERE
jgi:hypothetical protein